MAKRLTLTKIIELIESKNGKLLSTEYKYNKKLSIKCEFGHIFPMLYNSVDQGQWCPKCNKNKQRNTIENVLKLVESKGGKLLSTEYINNYTKLNIKCKFDHIFWMNYNDLTQKCWCSICGGTKKKTIEDCKKLIELKNGTLLSIKYNGAHKKLDIKCASNHIFPMSYSNIKKGSWCPHCKIPLSELICKYMIEQIFNKPFAKIKPSWLENPKTGWNLEIDLYNEELNIGFEHNGLHHYKANVYSKNKNDLKYIQELDQLKIQLCNLHNTKLIIIPVLFKKTKLEKLQEFIISECKKNNINISNNISKIDIDINKIYREWYNKI